MPQKTQMEHRQGCHSMSASLPPPRRRRLVPRLRCRYRRSRLVPPGPVLPSLSQSHTPAMVPWTNGVPILLHVLPTSTLERRLLPPESKEAAGDNEQEYIGGSCAWGHATPVSGKPVIRVQCGVRGIHRQLIDLYR